MSTDLVVGARDDVAQARLVAREQRQPRALGGEPLRDRAPDPGPGSGDDDVLPLEAIHAGESTGAARAAPSVRRARTRRTPTIATRLQRRARRQHGARVVARRAPSRRATSPIGEPMHWKTPNAAMPCVRSSRGMRSITSACIGAFTSDMKKPATPCPRAATTHGAGSGKQPERGHLEDERARAERQRLDAAHDPHRDERADERAAAERAEQPAEDPRIRVVLRDDEHGQRREEQLPADVEQRERRRPDAQQLVAEQEAHAVEDAAGVARGGDLRRMDERGDEHERRRRRSPRRRRGSARRRARRSARPRAAARGRSSAGSPPGRTRSRTRRRAAPRRRAPARPRAAPRSTAR